MLTKKEFDKINPGDIFDTGIQPNSPDGIFMTRDGGNLKWVAVKGYANDWAIYTHWDYNSIDYIKQSGDKLHNQLHIKLCVPCDNEVYKLYRF